MNKRYWLDRAESAEAKWRAAHRVLSSELEWHRTSCENCIEHTDQTVAWCELAQQIVNLLPHRIVDSSASPQRDNNWSVKELIETAEKLLEWMPICSKGSSGDIRQTNLRAAIDKFKARTDDLLSKLHGDSASPQVTIEPCGAEIVTTIRCPLPKGHDGICDEG